MKLLGSAVSAASIVHHIWSAYTFLHFCLCCPRCPPKKRVYLKTPQYSKVGSTMGIKLLKLLGSAVSAVSAVHHIWSAHTFLHFCLRCPRCPPKKRVYLKTPKYSKVGSTLRIKLLKLLGSAVSAVYHIWSIYTFLHFCLSLIHI